MENQEQSGKSNQEAFSKIDCSISFCHVVGDITWVFDPVENTQSPKQKALNIALRILNLKLGEKLAMLW
jgi:hypothetical protein